MFKGSLEERFFPERRVAQPAGAQPSYEAVPVRVTRGHHLYGLGLSMVIVMIDRQALHVPSAPNEVWSMDFVMDALANGRRLKCLTIVDDFTRECLDIPVDHGISGAYVARVLDGIGQFRGLPRAIRTDQGPEFTSRALDRWAYPRGVDLKLIAAGKPTQNAYIESFNGKFRDECLNDHYFTNLAHARAEINTWRRDYYETRPHSSLGRIPQPSLQRVTQQS